MKIKSLAIIALALFSLASMAQEVPLGEKLLDGNFDVLKAHGNTNRHWGYSKDGKYHGWIADFYAANGSRCEKDTENFKSQPNSLKIVSVDDKGNSVTQYFHEKLKPSTKYRISCKVKLQNVVVQKRGGGFFLNLWDDANRWFPSGGLAGTSDWQELSFEHKTSATVDQSKVNYLKIRLLQASGTAWVDDVSIMEITE